MRASIGLLPHHPTFRPDQEVYHYTSTKAAIAILASQSVWLTEYTKLNDAEEYTYAETRFRRYIAEMRNGFDHPVGLLSQISLVTSQLHTHMFIGSLTERRDDLGQWRMYADDGAGCVIGISAEHLEMRAGVAVRKIRYSPGELKQFVRAGLHASE
jgi:hypothetical protein